MEKYLIINPFGIGDVLFTTPVIRALKDKYPDCLIGYWCNERVRGLLRNNPDIDRIFALSRGDIKRIYKNSPLKRFKALLDLISEIRAEKFKIAFDFSLDSRYAFWSRLAGIKKRIGFNYNNRGKLLTSRVDLKGYSGRHVVEYYTDLLKFIGITIKDKSLSLPVSEENKTAAEKRLTKYGIAPGSLVMGVAMAGGMSWGKDAQYKQWPANKFSQLIDILIKKHGAYVILLGSADEAPIADAIISEVKDEKIVNLTGKISLEELALVIKRLKVLICNDGGPLHMAVALGVNTVSIFGPVDEKVYGPYPSGEKHIAVKKDLPCRPCYENFRFKGCLNNKKCLDDIAVNEVYDNVKRLI